MGYKSISGQFLGILDFPYNLKVVRIIVACPDFVIEIKQTKHILMWATEE